MNGLDRIRFAAERTGFAEANCGAGYHKTLFFRHTDGRTVTIHRTVNGGITYATRSWGTDTDVRAGSGRAEKVVRWLDEPKADQGTPEPVKAASEPEKAFVAPASWDRSPEKIVKDLNVLANRIQALASELGHALAMHSLQGTGTTLEAVKDQLEVTSEGTGATIQGLEGLQPTVLNLWLELAYGSEFARKFRKASRMMEDQL